MAVRLDSPDIGPETIQWMYGGYRMQQWPARESNEWTIEEAEQHFDDVFDRAFQDGPQLLIDGGVPVAYLVSREDWRGKQAGLPLVHEEKEAE